MKTQREIGRLPVSRGEYVPGMALYRGNLVTFEGSAYEVVVESTTSTPSIDNPDYRLFAGGSGNMAPRVEAVEHEVARQAGVDADMQSEITGLGSRLESAEGLLEGLSEITDELVAADTALGGRIDSLQGTKADVSALGALASQTLDGLSKKLDKSAIVVLSESEYEALGDAVDDDKYYFITEDE